MDPAPLEQREAGWTRSQPLPEITRAFLDEQLAAFPDVRDRDWRPLGGGLRSLNLRAGDLVARVALGDEGALAKEVALLEALEGVVRVPRVEGVSARAALLEYVPHVELPGGGVHGERVGHALARIQGWRFEQAGFFDRSLIVREPFPSALAGLRTWADGLLAGPAGEALGPTRVSALRAAWDARADDMAAAGATPVLVHSDFKPTNIKWLPAEDDVLVLDWEFAWAGPALFDLGMLLRWQPPAPFVAGVVRGLEAGGVVLPPDWPRLGELFDLFNLVGFLESAAGVRRRDVLARVDQTLAGR